jgi:ABC-type multidrug transport system fused ATPase/permease subunit
MLSGGHITAAELMYLGAQTHIFYFKLKELRDIYNHYIRKQTRINTIYQILISDQLENINENRENDNKVNDFDISFTNVTFGYKADRIILNNLNLYFESNKVNLLMGPNGSGKTTIIKLLLRLYDLEGIQGEDNSNIIEINGYNIKKLSKKYIRENISFVSQEPHIFNDTVVDNIYYGNNSNNNILNYNDLLNLEDWIFENKDKKCGFMGKNLSGGEKKKIQLLNAICGQSKVIIFDEPSNALDKVAIGWFVEFIKKLKNELGKTIIIITHDARLKVHADKIIDINEVQG